jgi:predicted TIM-barrel fold metal-dependent hydrolase
MYDKASDSGFNALPTRLYADPEQRIKEMSQFGIDIQVLSFAVPGVDSFEKGMSIKLSKLLNNEMSMLSEKYPENFAGLASIPFADQDNALDELNRAIRELGMRGVVAYNNIEGKYLDSPEFAEIFRRIESLSVPVYVHPTIPVAAKVTGSDYNLNMLLGWPFETSITMARIALSGLLEKFPNLKFIISHGGGMIPMFGDRISALTEAHSADLTGVSQKASPTDSLKKMSVDLAFYGSVSAMRCTLDFFSDRNCLFASDYPFGPDGGLRFLKLASHGIQSLDLPSDALSRVLELNASQLLRLN